MPDENPLLTDVDVESAFWRAAAEVWPDVQKEVIAEWMRGQDPTKPRPLDDLEQPQVECGTGYPAYTLHTRGNRQEVVLTATLPMDDAWALFGAWWHYDNHECDQGGEAAFHWTGKLMELLRRFWQANPPTEPYPPFMCSLMSGYVPPDDDDDDDEDDA